jgi:PAS domain S-box-containing protein
MYMPGKLPTRTSKRQTKRPPQEALSRPAGLSYDQAIRAVQAHLDGLQQRAVEDSGASDAVLSEAFEELHITLEELHIANEERLQQHEELASTRQIVEGERRRYQELFDFAPHGYLLTDAAAVIRQANRAAAVLFGVPQDRLQGKPLVLFVAQNERHTFLTRLNRLPRQEQTLDWEVRLQPRSRSPLCADLTVATVRDGQGEVVELRWLIHDVTERKAAEAKVLQAEHALRSSREQLRALTTHLQNRQEEERRQLAREIHDELGQALTVLKIDAAWLSTRLGAADASCRERLQSMTAQLDALVTSVHRIGTELRPGLLDDLGLTAAIEWQLQEVCKRTGLACESVLPADDLAIDQGQATAMFRIFQESLTNVLRHADADKITVRLTQQPDALLLEVSDNGKGITPRQLRDRRALGLLSMRERAHLWGGHVSIKGESGAGTTVTLRMPHPPPRAVGPST